MSTPNHYSLDALQEVGSRAAMAIFCDDVRSEASGKLIVIGMYGNDIVVPNFPALLPQLHVLVTVWTRASNPFKRVVLRLLADEKILIEETLEDQALAALFKQGEESAAEDSKSRLKLLRNIGISPFLAESEQVLRVRIETEDGELRAGAVRIRKGEVPTN